MTTGASRRGKRERVHPRTFAPPSQRAFSALPHSVAKDGPGWWLAVAVVAGLLAMHGLGVHGLHFPDGASSRHPTSSLGAARSAPIASTAEVSTAGATAVEHGDSVQAEPRTAGLDDASLVPATGTSHEPSGGDALVGMCLTLLAFGALWLRRWIGGRPVWTIPRRAFATLVAPLPVTARDLSPPLRAELSIWRC
jgi:hypothetical protein